MQNMFRERLIAILPEPQLELDLEIIDLFESLNYTAPHEVLQKIMEVSTSNIDTAQYLMRIDSTFNDALDDLLLAFGVEVTESTPLAYKHDLARGITQLPFYYLPIEVLNILDGTFQNDVILAELIQLTRSVSVEESLEYIKTVNDGLITTIGEEMRKLNAFQDAVSDTVAIKLDRSRVSNMIRFHISMMSDLAGDSIINISLEGEPVVQFIAPTFTDSLFSPMVTTNGDAAMKVSNDMISIASNVLDLGQANVNFSVPAAAPTTLSSNFSGVNYDAEDFGIL